MVVSAAAAVALTAECLAETEPVIQTGKQESGPSLSAGISTAANGSHLAWLAPSARFSADTKHLANMADRRGNDCRPFGEKLPPARRGPTPRCDLHDSNSQQHFRQRLTPPCPFLTVQTRKEKQNMKKLRLKTKKPSQSDFKTPLRWQQTVLIVARLPENKGDQIELQELLLTRWTTTGRKQTRKQSRC